MTEENQTKLINMGGVIKKITIDKNDVIKGDKQLIFQMNKKITEEVVDWNNIKKNKYKR